MTIKIDGRSTNSTHLISGGGVLILFIIDWTVKYLSQPYQIDLRVYIMSVSDNCKGKDGASKSNDEVGKLQNMSLIDTDVLVSVCANCGKEGSSDNMNTCNKCKQVWYCNAACKKKHRSKHKKECRKRAAELHDIELFKQPPPAEDCPICFIRIPMLVSGSKYNSCCGKVICSGCIHAPVYDDQGNEMIKKICPFCRVPTANSYEEYVERLNKRVEAGDFIAIGKLGGYYAAGKNGFPQDYTKALELWHRAADLGYSKAYGNIGWAYLHGSAV